jgi:hypothetical protein
MNKYIDTKTIVSGVIGAVISYALIKYLEKGNTKNGA